MKNTYDRNAAERLVPLLRAISEEIVERTQRIEALEDHLGALDGPRKDASAERECRALGADLATQRRGLRLSVVELGRFGCDLDADRLLLIRIPGSDGRYESGFEWDALQGRLAPSTLTHSN